MYIIIVIKYHVNCCCCPSVEGVCILISIPCNKFSLKKTDVQMNSPENSPPHLRGASRTVGGFARGHALGNVVNIADA